MDENMTAKEVRWLDVRDEADFLMTCKGYSASDAFKAAQHRVLPLSEYEKRWPSTK